MQEELEQKTVALVFKAARITGEELSRAMHKALESGLNHQKHQKESHGKMTVAELLGKNGKIAKADIKEDDLKGFQKTASKYKVDYAVYKEPDGDKNKYYVFFQAKDTVLIESAFKEFMSKNERKQESVQAKLDKKKEIVNERKSKERAVEKHKNKEISR